jgi:predicted aminopeptidase
MPAPVLTLMEPNCYEPKLKKIYPVIQKEQVVLNVEAAPTEGLSNETWTFQISRLHYTN